MSNFGETFKALLRHNKMTQVQYSKLTEQDPTHVSHLVNNRRSPSFKELQKIKELFPEADLNVLVYENKGSILMTAEETATYEKEATAVELIEQAERLLACAKKKL